MVQFQQQNLSVGTKVVCAGTAGCVADIFTFPLDTAKVRLQVQGESSNAQKSSFSFSKARAAKANFRYKGVFGTIATVAREEGPQGLYRGIVPGLQRQMCFCAVRIGLYDSIKDFYTASLGFEGVNMVTRIGAGITSGGLAVLFAQPTDVVKVRMQAQSTADPTKPKRYTGAFQAYRKIYIEEGLRGLWKGTIPNVTRNAVVNASELVSYDIIKTFILKRRLLDDNIPCHFASAFGAGFITTCVASPVDVVKTRYMNSHPGQYKGAFDCAFKMFREGGPMAFYKGFMPNFVRLGAWNIVMFVTFEQLKRAASQYNNSDRKKRIMTM